MSTSGRVRNQSFAEVLFPFPVALPARRGCSCCGVALLFVLACILPALGRDTPPSPGGSGQWLDFWSFGNTNTWHSDLGFAPISFTNIAGVPVGAGNAMVLDSTNAAWLRYNVAESDGTNNLAVNQGTVMFWFAPSWAGTNQGGTGPGQWGRLIEAGSYTSNAAYGWWSLYFDNVGCNIYFSGQTNNGSGATYLAVPVSLTSNYWHLITLTYCSTGSALYWDGALLTNGSAVTYWPGPSVLTNGFWIGSDSNGVAQAHGMFSDVSTYNYVLDSGTISGTYSLYSIFYLPTKLLASAPPNPGTNASGGGFSVFTGAGLLSPGGTNLTGCVVSNRCWFKDVSATPAGTNLLVTFTIAGGTNAASGLTGAPQDVFDVFATEALPVGSITNGTWALLGRAYRCVTNQLTASASQVFLIASTIEDSDRDGLTDAYELLVSKTNPMKADTFGDGMLDGWRVIWGLPTTSSSTLNPAMRANYGYEPAGRLGPVTGWRTETITVDPEGNVKKDSQ